MEKERINVRRLSITLSLILLTAALTGGMTWYFMDQANQMNKSTIDSLKAQVEKYADNLNKSEIKKADEEISSWKIYTNKEYNFKVSFPESWEGYKVEKRENSDGIEAIFDIKMETKDEDYLNANNKYASVFAISIYTPKKLMEAETSAVEENFSFYPGTKVLARNSKYVFLISYPNDIPGDFKFTIDDWVWNSFELI